MVWGQSKGVSGWRKGSRGDQLTDRLRRHTHLLGDQQHQLLHPGKALFKDLEFSRACLGRALASTGSALAALGGLAGQGAAQRWAIRVAEQGIHPAAGRGPVWQRPMEGSPICLRRPH